MMKIEDLSDKYRQIFTNIYDLYHKPENRHRLLFHGWHHIKFVHDKAYELSSEFDCNLELVLVAALLHDLNFIYSDRFEPEAANKNISDALHSVGYTDEFIKLVLMTIENSHIAYRFERELSNESKILADADTLFKALPTTPILFTSKFITENSYDIKKLASKIVSEQSRLMESGTYFYTKKANDKYLKWAKNNLQLWIDVLESLEDESVLTMLNDSKDMEVI